MAVTIQMIGEKEFKIKAHGYDQDEVDEFLDEIADEFEEMEGKIRELSAHLAEAQEAREAAEAAARVSVPAQPVKPEHNFATQEESIRNLLINTQRVCDETLASAQERAKDLVKDARDEAERIVADAHSETQQLEDEMSSLRAGALDFRTRFQRLIDDQVQLMKSEGDLFKKK